MSIRIPALHAGMTNRGVLLKVTEAPPPLFSKETTKGSDACESKLHVLANTGNTQSAVAL